MVTNLPPPDAVIAKAAELKAGGRSWEQVAAEVGYSPQTVRKWPVKYPTRWRKVQGEAERRVAAEAAAEAVNKLRVQLRDPDAAVSRAAARELLSYRLGVERLHRPKRAARGKPAVGPRVGRIYQEMPHDRYNELLGIPPAAADERPGGDEAADRGGAG